MDTVTLPQQSRSFPLPQADLEQLGFRKNQIDRLIGLIEKHIAEGRYPGCQIALARHASAAPDDRRSGHGRENRRRNTGTRSNRAGTR